MVRVEAHEVDLGVGAGHRVRVSSQALSNESGEIMGRVLLFKEFSHEPLRRELEDIVAGLSKTQAAEPGVLRASLESALSELEGLGERVRSARVDSANMSELGERLSRTRTAIGSWLDVDDSLAGDDFPDAQLLRDRLNVALQRWPSSVASF